MTKFIVWLNPKDGDPREPYMIYKTKAEAETGAKEAREVLRKNKRLSKVGVSIKVAHPLDLLD